VKYANFANNDMRRKCFLGKDIIVANVGLLDGHIFFIKLNSLHSSTKINVLTARIGYTNLFLHFRLDTDDPYYPREEEKKSFVG
jgi:hypothetical protein